MINSSIRPNEILIASNLCYIRILDLNSFTFILKIRVHDRRINCLEFLSPEIFLSASSDLTIKIWSLESSKNCLQTIECHPNDPRCLRKINETTFACLYKNSTISIFNSDKDIISFKCYKTLILKSGTPRDIKVCSDLNLLMCSTEVIHLYSLSDFTCVATLCQNRFSFARSMEILPNNRLIVANKNHTYEMWCLKTCQSLSIHKDHSSLANEILFYNN